MVFHINGLIQGIGFRPFIYRIATKHKICGKVYNRNDGVIIYAQGTDSRIEHFYNELINNHPPTAEITEIKRQKKILPVFKAFTIEASINIDETITQVSPDIAVCHDCLNDMTTQANRIEYSFTNCTNCGPRFSIIENIPYDRQFTSMKHFDLCEKCKNEFNDISDRRFHAQPVACNKCGPFYTLQQKDKKTTVLPEIFNILGKLINSGKSVILKGLGGYHLACDAFNAQAVNKLRKIKQRDGKPFAIMFKNIESTDDYLFISNEEKESLISWRRPIVLLKAKNKNDFPVQIANGLNTLGVFLPYLPFHHQLFEHINTSALVMTSGNVSDCPIIKDDTVATKVFGRTVSAVLSHNREIVNRVDDSVVQKDKLGIQIIRRSRGYIPSPILTNLNTEGILATGAELANSFCIGKGNQAIMSQHIGDLKNLETMSFFEDTLMAFKRLFKFKPSTVACDMHPDYLSSEFARKMGIPIITTQHHHSHIAAVMAEYNIDEKVIGISLDGTGFGTDGKIWGSEIMIASLEEFDRKYHFQYVPIPGGDKAAYEPWRSSVAYLHKAYNGVIPDLPFLNKIDKKRLDLVILSLSNKINVPESCSAGRLFDAVSGLVNLCLQATYHAEAPILLEHNTKQSVKDSYPVSLENEISWNNTIDCIINDITNNVAIDIISTKFHNAVAKVIAKAIEQLHIETGINKVVLSGGTFQNRYLLEKVLDLTSKYRLKVFSNRKVPLNDGGIALGQLAIAAKIR